MTPQAPTRRSRVRRYAAAARRELRAVVAARRARRPLGPDDRCTGSPEDGIVSLTSYPPRIPRVHLTVRSLLLQSRKPGRVELVLAEEEFPGRVLPVELTELLGRGLVVQWVQGNIRSFKKLVPLLDDLEHHVVVTVDDDIVYPSTWFDRLWTAHLAEPGVIWGTRGRAIGVQEGRLLPYEQWAFADRSTPSSHTLLTGMGGILYPPGSLAERTRDMDEAMRLCPRADDVWFKAGALLAGTPARQLADEPEDLPTRWSAQRESLQATNLHQGENDEQVVDTFAALGLLPLLGVRADPSQ